MIKIVRMSVREAKELTEFVCNLALRVGDEDDR
jgi:hypothetical protein